MLESKKELGPLHCLYFIYYSFTKNTDENHNNSQIHKIITYLNEWTKDVKTSEAIISETMTWIQETKLSQHDSLNTMVSMVDYLNKENTFSIIQKEFILLNIREIARSDGNFSEIEKKYHDLLSFHFNLSLRASACSKKEIKEAAQKVERKKIGFKISRN